MKREPHVHPADLMNDDLFSEIVVIGSIAVAIGAGLLVVVQATTVDGLVNLL